MKGRQPSIVPSLTYTGGPIPDEVEFNSPDPAPDVAKAAMGVGLTAAQRKKLYREARASGCVSQEDYVRAVGRALTPEEEAAIAENVSEQGERT